ncbi:MAG: CotH kinase family protein, partial [Bacteroidales bacterium]|nr:CotH kinase family protein [Bacteroidales bacterium]
MKHALVIIITLFLTLSCYREVIDVEGNREVFELTVSPGTREFIEESRDTSYTIEDPDLYFMFNEQPVELKEIRTRGKSALRFQRKSYSVFLNEPISIRDREGDNRIQLNRFKLLAMAMDYTYIESRVGFGILEQAGIMPLFYKYVELRINGDTQGVYLLVEDPEQFAMEQGSEFILRRGYHHGIADSEYEPTFHFKTREEYEIRFKEIYTQLPLSHGEERYEAISQRIDLNQYFRKMGIDYLLQNGDYTDEVYFYALVQQDQIRFSIIPWDYDDLFRSYPHEVGLTWGTGHLFGDRYYASHQDILNEIGNKLIFSIEDDLDYAIAMDPYLYGRYESSLAAMLEKMSTLDIDQIFEQVKNELTPFYYNKEVIFQSQFDQHETSFKLWEENMAEK